MTHPSVLARHQCCFRNAENKATRGGMEWYRSHPESAYFLPSVALYELQAGVEITRRQDALKADELQRWIDALANAFSILSLDSASAMETARLMHGKSGDLFEDAMIAAISITNNLTVATRNVKHFADFPVRVVNPFSEKT